MALQGTSTPCAAVMQVIDDEICYRWSEYENMRVPLDLSTFLLLHSTISSVPCAGMHGLS